MYYDKNGRLLKNKWKTIKTAAVISTIPVIGRTLIKRDVGYNPYVVLGRVSGTRDGAADGLTSHGWVIIDGCYYDPEAQFAGWYKGVYGSGSYDINLQIKSIVRFAS